MQCGVIMGCGAMGKCHGEAYQKIPNAEITAVVDIDREKGETLAARLGCRWVPTLDELCFDRIDFVDICLPTHLHLAAIRQAGTVTKNILCEKPLAIKEEELNEICRLIQENGLRIMTAQVVRFWNCYKKAYELVKNRMLGEVTSISCSRRQKRPEWSTGSWLHRSSLSGGLVHDLMIHDIDYVVWLMGMPKTVWGDIVCDKDQIPLHAKAQLRYETCSVDLFASWGMPGAFDFHTSLEVIGGKGMIFCDSAGAFIWTDHEKTQALPLEETDPYAEELRYFIDCCEKDQNPDKSDAASVLDSLKTARAVSRSAALGREIAL